MTFQLSVGDVKYTPARDICYLYPSVFQNVMDRIADEKYKPLHEWLKSEGVTEKDFADALSCYARYMNMAHQDPEQSMWDVLTECGWNDCRWEAQVAVMFYTGILMTGTFFKGIRDVVPAGGVTPPSVAALVDSGRQLDMYMSMGPRKRWLYGKSKWIKHLLRRGKGIYTEV